jgi:hypothetical protein
MALSPEEHAAVVSRCNKERRAHEKLQGLQTGPKSAGRQSCERRSQPETWRKVGG